jgi:hypothetical protein
MKPSIRNSPIYNSLFQTVHKYFWIVPIPLKIQHPFLFIFFKEGYIRISGVHHGHRKKNVSNIFILKTYLKVLKELKEPLRSKQVHV